MKSAVKTNSHPRRSNERKNNLETNRKKKKWNPFARNKQARVKNKAAYVTPQTKSPSLKNHVFTLPENKALHEIKPLDTLDKYMLEKKEMKKQLGTIVYEAFPSFPSQLFDIYFKLHRRHLQGKLNKYTKFTAKKYSFLTFVGHSTGSRLFKEYLHEHHLEEESIFLYCIEASRALHMNKYTVNAKVKSDIEKLAESYLQAKKPSRKGKKRPRDFNGYQSNFVLENIKAIKSLLTRLERFVYFNGFLPWFYKVVTRSTYCQHLANDEEAVAENEEMEVYISPIPPVCEDEAEMETEQFGTYYIVTDEDKMYLTVPEEELFRQFESQIEENEAEVEEEKFSTYYILTDEEKRYIEGTEDEIFGSTKGPGARVNTEQQETERKVEERTNDGNEVVEREQEAEVESKHSSELEQEDVLKKYFPIFVDYFMKNNAAKLRGENVFTYHESSAAQKEILKAIVTKSELDLSSVARPRDVGRAFKKYIGMLVPEGIVREEETQIFTSKKSSFEAMEDFSQVSPMRHELLLHIIHLLNTAGKFENYNKKRASLSTLCEEFNPLVFETLKNNVLDKSFKYRLLKKKLYSICLEYKAGSDSSKVMVKDKSTAAAILQT